MHLPPSIRLRTPKRALTADADFGPNWFQWSIPFISIAIGFVFFLRTPSDLLATVQHAMLLLDSVARGHLTSFYETSVSTTIMPAMYGITFYAIFALLLAPFAFGFAAFSTFDYTNALQVEIFTRIMQIWIILLVLLGTLLIYRLSLGLGYSRNRASWAAYLFLASPITLFSDTIFWQYDIITIIFLIVAMNYYFQRRLLPFAAIMAFAISCKLFAFFAFIPLLCLSEKHISRLLGYAAIGMSLPVITEAMQHRMPGYDVATGLRAHILDKLFDIGIGTGFGSISLAIVAIVLITVFSLFAEPQFEHSFKYRATLTAFTSIAVPFALFQANTYWWIFVTPFAAILIAGHEKIDELMLTMTGFAAFLLLFSPVVFGYYMDQNMVNGGIFARVFGFRYSGRPSFQSILGDVTSHTPALLYSLTLGLILATVAVLFRTQRHALLDGKNPNSAPVDAYRSYDPPLRLPSQTSVILYNAGLYVFILPSLALYFREILFK